MSRLILLLVAAAFAAGVATAPGGAKPDAFQCGPTPQDGFGPFGRGLPPIRSKIGSGHVLSGVVLSALDCRPIRGAHVQFWQANKRGRYTRATSATVLTDRLGRFRFQGPFPPSYEGREPHIHIRVAARDHRLLVARYVPARGATRGAIRLVLEPESL